MGYSQEEYNNEPVYYCGHCLSLRIIQSEDVYQDFCDDCGCVDIQRDHIENWEEKYIKRYNKKLIEWKRRIN